MINTPLTQSCAKEDMRHIINHYKSYYEELEILESQKDRVRFRIVPKCSSRSCEIVLSPGGYEVMTDPDPARSLVGMSFESFESVLAALMGPTEWQELVSRMITEQLTADACT